jgi:hypothetical protein
VKAPNGTFWYVNGNGAWQEFTTGGSGDCCNGTIEAEGNVAIESTGGSVGVDAADEINVEAVNNVGIGSINGTITVQSRGNATMQSLNGNLLLNSPNGNVLVNGVKVYKALLTQSGTDAPVATILENSLGGTIVWTYNTVGTYIGTLVDAFPSAKTAVHPIQTYADGIQSKGMIYRGDDANIYILTSIDGITLSNGELDNNLVYIEVYP